ncbi:MAG: hypothetical protein B7Z61_09350 [Acidobacteria bacterium 37-71-11]|nr:MAG: hypothetical protein B7Z61_09350 [Acidobacteria bacterium 37-71-11]
MGLAGRAGGELVGVRVKPGAAEPLRVTFHTVLAAPVNAIGTAAGEIIALAGEDLVVLSRKGRHPRRVIAVPGATGLAVVPAQPQSTVPAWSDETPP